MAPSVDEPPFHGLDPDTLVCPRWPNPAKCPPLNAFTTTRQTHWSQADAFTSAHWLRQVHGTRVISLDAWQPGIEADGAWTDRVGAVAAIQTADCLPIFLTGHAPAFVAVAHAGWRGLAAGMVASAVAACPGVPGDMQAWIGPAISQTNYEVDEVVYRALMAGQPPVGEYFQPSRRGHWWADLAGIAVWQLHQAGVPEVAVSGECTAQAPEKYWSYRARSQETDMTERMISLIWLA